MKTPPRDPQRLTWVARAATLLVATLPAWSGLVGCSASLLPKPPAAASRYTLDGGAPSEASALSAVAAAPAATADKARVLLVAQPVAAPGYDSVRMLYQRQPFQLEAFAFHEWVEPPARLLTPLLVQALQDTLAFRAVLLAPTAGTGALRLETELIRLQQDFATRPSRLRLTVRAVLIDTATRQVLASQVFDATAVAGQDDPVAGVAAAQQATRRLPRADQPAAAAFRRNHGLTR